MPAHAAFLRGINVGGHRAGGGELRSAFARLGLEGVATFRASGNVIFSAAGEPVAQLAARIEEALEDALEYEVPVFLRTAAEVLAIAEREPFPRELIEASKGKLQVLMLLENPAPEAQREVRALASVEDALTFGDRELFWLPIGGTL